MLGLGDCAFGWGGVAVVACGVVVALPAYTGIPPGYRGETLTGGFRRGAQRFLCVWVLAAAAAAVSYRFVVRAAVRVEVDHLPVPPNTGFSALVASPSDWTRRGCTGSWPRTRSALASGAPAQSTEDFSESYDRGRVPARRRHCGLARRRHCGFAAHVAEHCEILIEASETYQVYKLGLYRLHAV